MENEAPTNQPPPSSQPSPQGIGHGDQSPPVTIPDHTLLRRIGQGSYGEVWLARNMMGTYRAVKIVFRNSFREERPYQRELSGIQKYEPVSRSYEGFVDVLHVGINEAEGYFYYVMELGDDEANGQTTDPENYSPRTLGKQIAECQKLSFQECLQLGLALSQALAELHKHNLVHRDVKPSNIIFVNGVPKLADIGLVAEFGEARSYVGTEGFIPPEGPGTAQADVYSLGKVLYEASTGKDRHDFPALPSLVDELTDREKFLELNEVILHACQNEPQKRYRTAWDMQADLLVLANGRSVKRLKLLERRLSSLKKISTIAVLAIIAIAAISFGVYREWRSVRKSRLGLSAANIVEGERMLEAGDPHAALASFVNAFRLDDRDTDKDNAHRFRCASALVECPLPTHMWFFHETLCDVEFNPTGNEIIVSKESGGIEILDLRTGKQRQHLKTGGFFTSGSFDATGSLIIASSERDKAAYIYTAAEQEGRRLRHAKAVMNARISPDGALIATACDDGVVRFWNPRSGEPTKLELKSHKLCVRWVEFSQDGRMLATGSEDGTAIIWNVATGQPIGKPLDHGLNTFVNGVAFSPDGKWFATACSDHRVRIWEISQGNGNHHLVSVVDHDSSVQSIKFSPDGTFLVSASLDNTVKLWRFADSILPTWSLFLILRHDDRVMHADVSPDGRCIVTACAGGTVRIWDLAKKREMPERTWGDISTDGSKYVTLSSNGVVVLDSHSFEIISQSDELKQRPSRAGLSANGRFLFALSEAPATSGSHLFSGQVCETSTGKAVGHIQSIPEGFRGISVSDSGERLLVFSDHAVQTFDVKNQKEFPRIALNAVKNARLNQAADRVVICTGSSVRICDVATGTNVIAPLVHDYTVTFANYNQDESCLVTCCSGPSFTASYAQVWESSTGRQTGPRLPHNDGVLYAAFFPDRRKLATAGEDSRVNVWDFRLGEKLHSLQQKGDQVQSVHLNQAGKWLVTASGYAVQAWDAESGTPLTRPLMHFGAPANAFFMGDDPQIATVSIYGNFRAWKMSPDQRPTDIDDLIRFARLLSGNLNACGDSTKVQPESVEALWKRLSEKYPAIFTASAKEITEWYSSRAEESEQSKLWAAAVFHLDQLLALHPGDQTVLDRLARAKAQLHKEQANGAE